MVGLPVQFPQLREHNPARQAEGHQMEGLFCDQVFPVITRHDSTHPGRISSKPVPLCVCRLNIRIKKEPSNDYNTKHTCGSGLEGSNMPGGKVLLMRVTNDCCSDHRVRRACSSKARQVHARDTRLILLRGRQQSMMAWANSLISIIR